MAQSRRLPKPKTRRQGQSRGKRSPFDLTAPFLVSTRISNPAASVQAHASAPVDLATFRAMLSDVAELATEITAEYGRVAAFLNAELQG